jgi:pyruvate dehydrogenase E2 component (dihydrolipoamide acetyltransferase)
VDAIVPARPPASPKARRLAAERGVDLSKLAGSGPGGAVVEDDILQAGAGAAWVEPALWRAMAENVSRSWREAPHFFVMREIDASHLVDQRGRQPDGVTYTDLLVKAVATALSSHPRMNGPSDEVNVGLAVAVPDGLIVPVIHGADRLSVSELSAHRRELLERVKAGRLRSSDLSGATFTISNLGMYGVDLFTAILPEGQTGILAVGRIADRVVAQEGAPHVRPTMLISLSCDHRRVDGARAAEFVQTLAALLEGG